MGEELSEVFGRTSTSAGEKLGRTSTSAGEELGRASTSVGEDLGGTSFVLLHLIFQNLGLIGKVKQKKVMIQTMQICLMKEKMSMVVMFMRKL